MVKIRLTRTGKKNAPSYRVVVADSKSPRDGKFIEIIGFYNPSHKPELVKIDEERYSYWISKGAQPSETVVKIKEGKYKFEPYTRQNENKGENTDQQQKEQEIKEDQPKDEDTKLEGKNETATQEDSKEENK